MWIRLLTRAILLTLTIGCSLDRDQHDQSAGQTKGPSAVLFHLDGPMPSFSGTSSLFASQGRSQYKLERLLNRAADDIQVQHVVIHFGALELSFARAGEIAAAVTKLAKAGKPVTCHLDSADNLTYFTAAQACPRVLISPAGSIDAVGLALEALYIRELLASLGIVADMMSVGKYKDAAEPLLRDSMSEASREAAQSLLSELHHLFVAAIAKGRGLEPARVAELIDDGPYDAKTAVKLGLADQVSPLGQFLEQLRDKYPAGVIDDYGKAPPKPFSFGELLKMFGRGQADEPKTNQNPHLALIQAIGPITGGTSEEMFGQMETVYDLDLVKSINQAARSEAVRGVVLRVDSPGGDALASDNIWMALRACAEKKPVIVSLGDVAASGGYYIASAGTEIFSSAATITGSIGVVGGKIVFSEAAAKYGIKTERLTTGKRAAWSSPFSKFSDDERAAISKLMHTAYDLFIERVTTGRKLEREKVLAVAEGRVWTGSQALKHGLVDKLGNLDDALARAREIASLPAGAPVEMLPRTKSFMELLSEALSESESPEVRLIAQRPSAKRALAMGQLLLHRRILTYAPILFEIY